MQVITHLHKPSTQLQSAILPTFLDARHPSLVIVKHSSLDFLLLPSAEGSNQASQEPLAKVAQVDFNARILAVSSFTVRGRERLAVLTDHHHPRLLILVAEHSSSPTPDAVYDIRCCATINLDETARLPAELGLGLWTVANGTRQAIIAHTHSGILKVLPITGIEVEEQSEYISRSFSARLPHPTILSLAPVESASQNQLTVALLSISSMPSTLPGLGSQCLPVLSYHSVDEVKHELVPIPWGGPDRKVPPLVEEFKSDTASGEASGSQSTRNNGPQAKGKKLTPEELRAREQKLAKSALARSHVQLPFTDALGAHLITPLPREAGGGVIVWCETSILIVPPPAPRHDHVDVEGGKASATTARDKRRKASISSPQKGRISECSSSRATQVSNGDTSELSTSPDATMLAQSPSSQANEHGKRRRSSAKKLKSPESIEPDFSSGAATSAAAGRKLLRLPLPRPLQVTSAEIIKEGGIAIVPKPGADLATVQFLFTTMAGALNILEIRLRPQDDRRIWRPASMKASKVGDVSRTSGPGSLTYLGEGYVHVASASGDSSIVQLVLGDTDDASAAAINDNAMDVEMVSPPVSPIKSLSQGKISCGSGPSISSALAHSQLLSQSTSVPDLPISATLKMRVVKSFPSLAPLLDFVVDGDPNAASGSTQARVVAACGCGPDGAIAVVKHGVSMDELGSLPVRDVRRLFSFKYGDDIAIVCAFAEHTRVLRLAEEGIHDVSEELGLDLSARTIESASIARNAWVHVTEDEVTFRSPNGNKSSWLPSQQNRSVSVGEKIIAASVDTRLPQVVVALKGGHVVLLSIEGETIAVKATLTLAEEVSAVHVGHGIVAVGQWKTNSVRLLDASTLADVTPSTLEDREGDLGSLPRSLLIHSFTEVDESANPKQLYLIIGLACGSITTCALAPPTADSLSKSVGVFDKKNSTVGIQPVRLLAFTTAKGKRAVLAVNGEAATVIWIEKRRLTYSTLSYPSVISAISIDLPGVESTLALALPDRIQLSSIKEIGQLDISKTRLGLDNPTAIIGVGRDDRGHYRHFAVVTTPFKPEGNSTREQRMSKVMLFDSTGLVKVAEIELEPRERAGCVGVLEADDQEYVVVGTGFVNPDESEVFEGRLLGYIIKSSSTENGSVELVQTFEKQVHGNVYAVTSILGRRLVAAVNSEVMSYTLEDASLSDDMDLGSSGPSLELRQKSRWGCAFIACTLSTIKDEPQRFIVGDGLRSMSILRVDATTGELREIARDCDPFWTTACAPLDSASQTFIGSDINFNLFTAQRATISPETKMRIEREEKRRKERAERGDQNAALGSSNRPPSSSKVDHDDGVEGEWSHIMERRGGWHYGDLINRFREGTLVSIPSSIANVTTTTTSSSSSSSSGSKPVPPAPPSIDPRLVFCTSSGALGIISTLDSEASRILSGVERNLEKNSLSPFHQLNLKSATTTTSSSSSSSSSFSRPLGEISTRDYRTLRTDHRTSEPLGFIDGDLLLSLYAQGLNEDEKLRILKDLPFRRSGGGVSGVSRSDDDVDVDDHDVHDDDDDDEMIGGIGKVNASVEYVDDLLARLSRVC